MPELTRKNLLILAGFILILASIPIGFALLKNTQIFNSGAKETKTETSGPVTKLREVPSSSTLNDVNKILESTGAANTTPTPSYGSNLNFGPTLNIKVAVEGRPADKNAIKAFVGIATGDITPKPSYLLTFTVDFPPSGVFNGLSLAGLNVGSTYTAYIKGPAQIDNAITFAASPTETNLNNGQALTLLTGDLNEDNTINSADYALAKQLYGATSTSANWNERADFNQDGIINNIDFSYIIKNFGKSGASGIWYSAPPPASGSAQLNVTPATASGGYNLSEDTSSRSAYEAPVGTSNQGGHWIWVPY